MPAMDDSGPTLLRIADSNTEDTSLNFATAAVFIALAPLMVWYFGMPLNVDVESPDFNPAILMPIVLVAFGLYYFALATRDALRRREFGQSVLEVAGDQVDFGGRLVGMVRTVSELRPHGDYELRLACIETVVSRGSSGRSATSEDHIRWEEHRELAAPSISSRAGIPVDFPVPESNGTRRLTPSGGSMRWVLEVRAPLENRDYYAIFGIPVRAPAPQEEEDDDTTV